MLRVTPVYGSRFSTVGEAEEPSCTHIEFAECQCLVNIGWRSEGDMDNVFVYPPHDFVLIVDSTLQSIGGLPAYYERQKLRWMNGEIAEIPAIYATYPTVKMGQMTLYDQHAAIAMEGGRPPYTLQSIDDVCAFITAIKYNQNIFVGNKSMSPHRASDLLVTAHRAGHVVGGAFYVFQRRQDETVVVITDATYHVAKELHLDSSTLLQHAATPDVLITRPGGPAFRQLKAISPQKLLSPLVPQAEKTLAETVLSVLRRDGNVLLPVDCSGRVLEVVLLLNQEWEKQRLQPTYHLIWFAPMCHNVLEFARSQLEWMASNLGSQFDGGSGHPYQLRSVKLCATIKELNDILQENQNPACVLASGLSLEGGPSRDVFLKWADNPDNAIIFTDSSQCYLRRSHCKSDFLRHLQSVNIPEVAADAITAEIGSTSQTVTKDDADRFNPEVTGETLDRETNAANIVPEDQDDDEVGATGEANIVVGETLTEATKSHWTTAGQLLHAWALAQADGTEMDDSVVVDVNVLVRSPLAGAELKAFLAHEEAARLALQRAEEKRALLAEVELAKGQLHLGEEETEAVMASKTTTVQTATAAASGRPKKKSRFDSSLFLKYSKPLHITFDVHDSAVGIGRPDSASTTGIGESSGQSGDVVEDDYGISVHHERFTDIVSGVDPSKFAGGSGRIGEDVTRRGFGFDGDSSRNASSSKSAARVISDEEDQENGTRIDEQVQEALDLSEGHGIIRGRNGRPPTKVSTVPRKVEVLAEISFVPGLEGRVDARAARQSVRALQPREVVVLGGLRPPSDVVDKDYLLTDEVSLLAEAAQSFATGSKNILTPSDGESVVLSVGRAAYGVRLVDTPYLTQEEREAILSMPDAIEPVEVKIGVCSVSLVDCVATGQKVALDNSIVLAPRQRRSRDHLSSIYVSDGEILLTDLRAEIIGLGMKAEYSAHASYSQLLVNGKILVKKEHHDEVGRMQVEGPLCEDFYVVRGLVCGQFVMI